MEPTKHEFVIFFLSLAFIGLILMYSGCGVVDEDEAETDECEEFAEWVNGCSANEQYEDIYTECNTKSEWSFCAESCMLSYSDCSGFFWCNESLCN